jgi:predicted ATPase
MLKQLTLTGFKSIKQTDIALQPLNIIIGANGAGKSNLISFFKLLNELVAGRLQQHIAESGRAQSLLYRGPKTTPQLTAKLVFDTQSGTNAYEMRLFYGAGDVLFFAEETLTFSRASSPKPQQLSLTPGNSETRLRDQEEPIAKVTQALMSRCRVYHFHDTTATARARQYGYVDDTSSLMPDAGNIAAFLHHMRNAQPSSYNRIIKTIRMIAPFFDDFVLEPTSQRDIILNWRERNSDLVFGPHQLSDGTLRAICLLTLLLQPPETLPDTMIIDEPELGLHPYALNAIASILSEASHRVQLIVSTQSSALLSHFNPEDVIVVTRNGSASDFQRLTEDHLKDWLDEYSLGELWEKNVFGGGPH